MNKSIRTVIMAIAARIDDEGRLILPDPIRSMLPKEAPVEVGVMADGSLRITLSAGHLSKLSAIVEEPDVSTEDMTLDDVMALVEVGSAQVFQEYYGK
ncbi:hypothetical protein [Sulfobacillus harzensis]|uniref:SpoVT-AbrB domain-containing protein n=1 Tax=Sulfobacillus harzensis TaxID=2729629 RepID=A0A7Y0L2Q3_9FIRM|nr:hypothetical protein [Sulfobacillus harzensis]NMP22197.1 hypothetical protein [Sulfobacillus harzensis]